MGITFRNGIDKEIGIKTEDQMGIDQIECYSFNEKKKKKKKKNV